MGEGEVEVAKGGEEAKRATPTEALVGIRGAEEQLER